MRTPTTHSVPAGTAFAFTDDNSDWDSYPLLVADGLVVVPPVVVPPAIVVPGAVAAAQPLAETGLPAG